MAEQPAGPIIDGLGIVIDLEDGDLVADAVILTKVVTADGEVSLSVSSSESMSWLDQLGVIAAASDLVRGRPYTRRDEGED